MHFTWWVLRVQGRLNVINLMNAQLLQNVLLLMSDNAVSENYEHNYWGLRIFLQLKLLKITCWNTLMSRWQSVDLQEGKRALLKLIYIVCWIKATSSCVHAYAHKPKGKMKCRVSAKIPVRYTMFIHLVHPFINPLPPLYGHSSRKFRHTR